MTCSCGHSTRQNCWVITAEREKPSSATTLRLDPSSARYMRIYSGRWTVHDIDGSQTNTSAISTGLGVRLKWATWHQRLHRGREAGEEADGPIR